MSSYIHHIVDIRFLQDPLLLYVSCCSFPCHGSWLLNTRLCMHCVFTERNAILNVAVPWYFSCSCFMFLIRLAILAFHVGSVRYTHEILSCSEFCQKFSSECIFLIDFSQHRCQRHSSHYLLEAGCFWNNLSWSLVLYVKE